MPTRWIIFADVHLGTPETQFPNQNYLYTADLLKAAVSRVQALRPDRVIIAGDLVNMGTDADYALAAELLAPLRDRIEPAVGNHELVRGSVAAFEQFSGVPAVRELAGAPLPTFLLNSGIEGLPMTQWRGRLPEAQLDWLRQRLARAAGPAIILCHHPLNATVRRSTEPMMSLDNSDELRAILESHGHDVLLLTGHTHYQHILPVGRLTCVACPPLAFWPHAFLVLDIDDAAPTARDTAGPTSSEPPAMRWAEPRISLRTERLFAAPEQAPDARAADPAYRARGEGTPADQSLTLELT